MMAIPVLDAQQAAAWDERARVTAKIPSRVLMESAGRGIAHVIGREFGADSRNPRLKPGGPGAGVILACGPGNNGGDGWVVARALKAAGRPVWAADAGGKRSPDCAANRALALASGVELLDPDEAWPEAAVLVDALLGTGASGAPRGAVGALAARLKQHGAPVVAVDGPTGLDLSTGAASEPVPAVLTVTFGGLRRGHLLGREWCGQLVVLDIGFPFPDRAWPRFVEDCLAASWLPGFAVHMHKGDRGRVLVIGGDHGMAGAGLHAARAALEAGAGLVKLAAHQASVAAAQATLPDVLTVATSLGPQLEPELEAAIAWADALILGPGLGRGEERTQLVRAVLEAADRPVVLDADALQVGLDQLRQGRSPRVLTPHAGEFHAAFPKLAKLLDTDRFTAARQAADLVAGSASSAAAAAASAVVLLKGVPTIVAPTKGTTYVIGSGNPALATGGSGDLLAGFIGAFLARGLAPAEAAAAGAQVLGRAADLAAAQLTVRATRPADVLAALPELWRRWAEVTLPTPPVLLELDAPLLV
ncbi:MAG: NAD(P)H-hydrate dehydratase [Gemmatimonadetes bacterium]|nr:NAD(P)H-hydrate dehydratase [Gemmatimonadota bacterium]